MRLVRLTCLLLALMLLSLQAMSLAHSGGSCADAGLRGCVQTCAGKHSGEPEQPACGEDCCALHAGPQPAGNAPLAAAFMVPQQGHAPPALAMRAIAPPIRPPAA